jgi:CRP-like cAMP-binding protein
MRELELLMIEPELHRPSPGASVAFGVGRHPLASRPTPRRNHLLAALPEADYERLLPDLEPVRLPLGWTLHAAGDREEHVHFLTAGIVTRFRETERGESTEFAITGREGVIGLASFLGGESTPNHAVVVSAGSAWRLPAAVLMHEFEQVGPLTRLLLRYTHALIAQIGQSVACSRHHPLEERLCRLILSCLDRMPSYELTMTQELIARMLGVRREGVTEAAGRLQKAGLVHNSRGRIAVLDRPGLEAHACECYAACRRMNDEMHFQEVIGRMGESPARVS